MTQETKFVSEGKRKAEAVLIERNQSGKVISSVTVHYRKDSSGNWTRNMPVIGGRHKQLSSGR